MNTVINLIQRCFLINRSLQNSSNHIYRTSNLLTLVRVLHCGFLPKDGSSFGRKIENRCSDVSLIAHVSKRNASKKAKNKKKAASSMKVDLSVGSDIIDLNDVKIDMLNVTKKLNDEFRQKYSARLTSSTLDNIYVTINGTGSPLFEVAEVKSLESEFIVTPMTGEKNEEKEVLKSIQSSGLHINPMLDGSVIRIPIPVASSEYKEKIMKLAKLSAEKARVAIRKIRQQGLVGMRKHQSSTSKDTLKLIEKQIQLLTDAYTQDIDNIVSKKSSELSVDKK